MLSTSLVMLSTISFALLRSTAFNASLVVSASNSSCVKLPLGLNGALTYLSKNLANLELLYARSLPLLANSLADLPAPYTKGVTNKDSDPNLSLFNNFLVASSLPVLSSLSSCVGPPLNKSPNVPISSTSATNASPAAPPNTPAANLGYLDFLFKSFALFKAFINSGPLKLA